MPESLPPEAFAKFLSLLNTKGIEPKVVAGQAVNIWARRYVEWDAKYSPLRPTLAAFEPFSSGDLELFRAARTAVAEDPALLEEDAPKDPFGKAWAPDGATWYLTSEEHGRLKIQSMNSILGLDGTELEKRLLPLEMGGANLLVPDPLALLQAKIANLESLNQKDRNDLKHARMLVRCVRAFIGEDIQQEGASREVLKSIGRLHDLLQKGITQRVAQKYVLDFSETLPIDILSQSGDSKLQHFMAETFPRVALFHPDQTIQARLAKTQRAAAKFGVSLPVDEPIPSITALIEKLKKSENKGLGPPEPGGKGGP